MKSDESTTFPPLFDDIMNCSSWEEWLKKTELYLIGEGYRKFKQSLKKEDFTFWKIFKNNEEEIYQIGVYFYDFRKFIHVTPMRIGLSFQCLVLNIDGRIDLEVSKNITLKQFELMSETFYNSMKEYYD